ncbi:MAG: acylphosphatase [bacterium]
MAEKNNETVELRLEGKVQGVLLRESLKTKAKSLKITGLVRNQIDGSVKLIVQGNKNKVEELISWLKNKPLSLAEIIIKLQDRIDQPKEFHDFQIIW